MSAKLADWQTYEDYPSWSHAVKFADFSYTLIAGIAGLIGFLEDIFTLSSKLRLFIQIIISALIVWLFLMMPLSMITVSEEKT